MIKVSIIVPIYNKEDFLERTIRSILNQTLKDIEIILVNDGSTDNSLSICKEFSSLDNRIVVIDQKNAGVSEARNAGIHLAKGEYLAFVDPDDWIEPEMYLNMYKKCTETKSDVCMCNYVIKMKNSQTPVKLTTSKDMLDRNYIINEILLNMIGPASIDDTVIMGSVWRLMIKKEFIGKYLIEFPKDIPYMEDLFFCIKIFSKSNKVCIDSACYYNYSMIEDSASRIYRENMFELQLNVAQMIEKVLKEENIYNLAIKRCYNRYINIGLGSIVNEISADNSRSFKNKILNIKKICSHSKIQESLLNIDYSDLSFRTKFKLYTLKHNKALLLFLSYKLAKIIRKTKNYV